MSPKSSQEDLANNDLSCIFLSINALNLCWFVLPNSNWSQELQGLFQKLEKQEDRAGKLETPEHGNCIDLAVSSESTTVSLLIGSSAT